MEANTVILSIEDYNYLRDFEKEIKANHAIRILWNYQSHDEIYTMDDAVIKIAKANEKLKYEIHKLKHPETKQPTIEEIKAMSWRKFRKWKAGKLTKI